jgi:hypothetical protein
MQSLVPPEGEESSGFVSALLAFSFAAGLALLLFALLPVVPLNAGQAPQTTIESDAEYSFGQMMQFTLKATTSEPIRKATLSVQTPNLATLLTDEVDVGLQEVVEVTRVVDLTRLRLAPFTTVTYWWSLETESGQVIDGEAQTLAYVDDQFTWQKREQDGIQINWSGDGEAMGQAAERAALNALPVIEAVIPVARPEPLQIYVYPSTADLRAALRLTGRDWVGAHAHPELGVILVADEGPVTGSTELARSIAHELAHLYLYEAVGEGYESAPLWLDEGIATMVESVADNPVYVARLEEAVASDQTIPLADLCFVLPKDEDQALLAYAQSADFVSYLRGKYGDEALQRLVAETARGADCQSAPLRALDRSLDELNADWLEQARPQSTIQRLWQSGRVWLIIIAAGFLLAGLLATLPRARQQ